MNKKQTLAIALGLAPVLLAGLPWQQAQAATARSGDLRINAPRNINLISGQIYTFDENCAVAQLSCERQVTTYEGTACSGKVLSDTKSKVDAPLPLGISNSCNLFDSKGASNSTSACAVNAATKKATKTITNCKLDAPTPQTCWSKVREEELFLNGTIASESVISASRKNTKNLPDFLRVSFSLQDEYNLDNGTLVTALSAAIKRGDSVIVSEDLESGLGVELIETGSNFLYLGNGSTGATGLLTTRSASYPSCNKENILGNPPGIPVNLVLNGVIAGCGSLGDTADSNDDEGGDLIKWWSADATLPLTPGVYQYQVGARVAELSWTATKTVNVNQGCTTK